MIGVSQRSHQGGCFCQSCLELIIGIPFCGSAHRGPTNPDGDHIPAPVWEPKAASVRSRLAKEPHFDQTVFNKESYVNLASKRQLNDALIASYVGLNTLAFELRLE